ncbi:MAG: hypothetical protein A2Z94_00065, partial [Gallionellales bacterium GWA2_55_18]
MLLAFAAHTAQANPIGAAVVSGQASFATSGKTLTVTNTPNAIINWQNFSIGANEITRFAQQSASSAVLNRVIANNPSNILGSLQSNGRVFLVNPSGIVFGANATVNVAGMVASTLNISNADFLAGRYRFTNPSPTGGGAGVGVSNAGSITAETGGQIYLIAPNVENTGIINAPNGEILLTAGHSVELVNSNDPNLRVNITAPAGDATNVGQLVASSGSLGLFGAVVKNSGTVNANSATMQGGKIVFKASQRVEISGTVSANSTALPSASTTLPPLQGEGGGGDGVQSVGNGGTIQILGNQVGIMDGATVTANGTQNGGTILIGGDYQGKNPNVQNAQITYVAPTATLSADGGNLTPSPLAGEGWGEEAGNGGKLIIWADNTTRAYGNLSARGGANGGNGGLIETSGHYLDVAGIKIDASAMNGLTGSWLLDPINVTIAATADAGGAYSGGIWTPSLTGSTITNTTIQAALNAGTSVTITTTGGLAEAGNITVSAPITQTGTSATTLILQADNNIYLNSAISATGVGGSLNLDLITRLGATTLGTTTVDLNGGTMTSAYIAGVNTGVINLAAGTTFTLNGAGDFGTLSMTGGTLSNAGALNVGSLNIVGAGVRGT